MRCREEAPAENAAWHVVISATPDKRAARSLSTTKWFSSSLQPDHDIPSSNVQRPTSNNPLPVSRHRMSATETCCNGQWANLDGLCDPRMDRLRKLNTTRCCTVAPSLWIWVITRAIGLDGSAWAEHCNSWDGRTLEPWSGGVAERGTRRDWGIVSGMGRELLGGLPQGV